MNVNVYNNFDIKLQGPLYNLDCYNFWDLNNCHNNFKSQKYYEHVESIRTKSNCLYNGLTQMAAIDFKKYDFNYKNYYDSLSKNVKRDINLCNRSNFYFKKYDFNKHIYDFVEINQSQKDKKGKINPWYLQEPNYFKNSHSTGFHTWEDEQHYGTWYGLFKYFKHYKQGNTITNEKLFAYCKILIDGEMATIGLIWTHANYQNKGLAYCLITSALQQVMENKRVKFFVYSGWGQYPRWKSRMLFQPMPISIIL